MIVLNSPPLTPEDRPYFDRIVLPHLTHEWQWLGDLIKTTGTQNAIRKLRAAHASGLVEWRARAGRIDARLQDQYRLPPEVS